jgi:hypothetical protein
VTVTNVVQIADADNPAAPEPGAEMRTLTMMISPAMAREWLDRMPLQRPLRKTQLAQLRRIIETGRWKVFPEGISLSPEGYVLDGQTRLGLIVETGKTLPLRVTFNVDKDLYPEINSICSPKGLAVALLHEGVSSSIAPICAKVTRMVFRGNEGRSPFDDTMQPTNVEGLETFRANPSIVDAAMLVRNMRSIAPSPGLLAYYLWQGLKDHPEGTAEFARKLLTAQDCGKGSPVLLLRDTFLKDRAKGITRRESDQALLIITTLNAHLRGKRLSSLRDFEFGTNKLPPITGGPIKRKRG